MNHFKSIEEVLSSDFALVTDGYRESEKTDRVLKSTKIEQVIYDDLCSDCTELQSYKTQGKEKLKTFESLVNDVFQSIYGLTPKYTDENRMSALSKSFNKGILEELMSEDIYTSIKDVCEGKELPSIGATEEFTEKLLENLDSIMNKASNGKGKAEALSEIEASKAALLSQISELLKKRDRLPESQKEQIDKKIVGKANSFMSKNEQMQMFAKLIENGIKQNRGSIRQAISMSASAALERADEIKNIVLAWGDAGEQMQKSEINTEILKRTAKSRNLRYIAKFLGRYKEILNSKRLAGYIYGRGEKYDLEYGNNISKAITSELVMLSRPEMVPLFIKKYQNKSLRQYRKREPEYKGKGDIIVCLDESGSTFGEKNAYGMAIAMVLYEICKVNNTNFAIVHFSDITRTETFAKNCRPPIETVLNCCESFLGGGTDFDNVLITVNELLCSNTFDKPDVVFITDGISDVSEKVLNDFKEIKDKTGMKLTGILLDKGECIEFTLKKFADSIYRTSELTNEQIVESIIDTRIN